MGIFSALSEARARPRRPAAPEAAVRRGMWVWDSAQVIGQAKTIDAFVGTARGIGVTDVYLYANEYDYVAKRNDLRQFNATARRAGMRVWALDGAREYFDDAGGPAPLFRGLAQLVAFNLAAAPSEAFYGFQADNEPNDLPGHRSFHDGLTDAQLSRAAGSGNWQASAAADRRQLMHSWLSISERARTILHDAGLKFGVAMPSWTSDYFGAPVCVSYPTEADAPRSVTAHMMELVDEYVIMTYNVDPQNAANRALLQLQAASLLPAARRPRVYASVEVTKDVGERISYADTPGKNSRTQVMADMAVLTRTLRAFPAFAGLAIEQYSGWQALPP